MVARDNVIQPLRKHMVRRLPSQEELALCTPIVLTDRDKKILLGVYTFGFLTSDLIELAFFPSLSGSRNAPSSCAYDRLRVLWLWSYLDRIELPVSRALGGRRPFLHALGRRGVSIVATLFGQRDIPVQRRRLDRLDDVFVEHDLTVATVWAQIQQLIRSTKIRALRWTSERDLRAIKASVKDPQTGRRLPFLPDGYFELDYPDDTTQNCFLEIDMGTLTLARFRRKVRAFEAYLAQSLFDRGFGYEEGRGVFEVLVLTHSWPRLKNLWAAARLEVAEDRWNCYSFATFEILQQHKFGGEVWLTLDNDYVGLLGSDAFGGKTDTWSGKATPREDGSSA